jgi:hypothetical protein
MSSPLSAPHPFLFRNDHPSPHHSHLDYGLKVGFEGRTYAVIKSVECACFELLRQRPPLRGVLIGLNGDVRCSVIEVEVNTYLDRAERPSVKIEGEVQYIDNVEAINRWIWYILPSAERSKDASPSSIILVDETRLKAYIDKYTNARSVGRPPQRPSIELALRHLSLSLSVNGSAGRASSLLQTLQRRSKWGWLIAIIAVSLLALGSWLWAPVLISLIEEPSSTGLSQGPERVKTEKKIGAAERGGIEEEPSMKVEDKSRECLTMMPPAVLLTTRSRPQILERLEILMISTDKILRDKLRALIDGWRMLGKTLECESDNRCAIRCQNLCDVELKVTPELSILFNSELDPTLRRVLDEGRDTLHALRGQVRCTP